MVGPQPPLSKHFTLKRKPKSAALRAELTQKGIFWLLINNWKQGYFLELLVLFYAAMAKEAVRYYKWSLIANDPLNDPQPKMFLLLNNIYPESEQTSFLLELL